MAKKNNNSKKVKTPSGRSSAKVKKRHAKSLAIFFAAVIFALVIAVIVIYVLKPSWFDGLINFAKREYEEYVSQFYDDNDEDDAEGVNGTEVAPIPTGSLTEISDSYFSVHFLELGNIYTGDSTLIKCGDTEVLIDAGSRQSSATTIKSYVDQYCADGKLEYVIATHAHQDHIAGFVGNSGENGRTGILYNYEIGTIIQFSGHNTTSAIYNNYVSAVQYAEDNGATVYDAKQCWYETDGAARQYFLDADKKLSIKILYNYYYENATSDENDYSVCAMLTYDSGNGNTRNYLFTGDLEGEGEKRLVENNVLPQVELFKGGHHGSKTSSTDELLSKIKPKYVAVCCCAGSTEYTSNNENTFPTQAFIDRISKYTDEVYCTTLCIDYKQKIYESMNGNIVFYMSGSELKLWCSNNTVKLKDTEWFKNNRTGWGIE